MSFSFDDLQKLNKENAEKFTATFNSFAKTSQAIANEVADYAKKSYEANQVALEKLSTAKSVDKAVEIQTEVSKAAYEAAVAKSQKIGEIYAELAKEAAKPFEQAFAAFSKNFTAATAKAK